MGNVGKPDVDAAWATEATSINEQIIFENMVGFRSIETTTDNYTSFVSKILTKLVVKVSSMWEEIDSKIVIVVAPSPRTRAAHFKKKKKKDPWRSLIHHKLRPSVS